MSNYLQRSAKLLTAVCLVLGFTSISNAQVLLTEDFNYVAGSTLTSNGWAAQNGAGQTPILVGANSLTFPSYSPTAIGGSAVSSNTGEDINKSFTPSANSDIYASFLLKVDTIGASNYFFHLMDSAGTTNYVARTFFRVDATNTSACNLGLTFNSGTGVYDTTEFALGDTILVVVKYTKATGASNDSVSLYAFTPNGSYLTEPGTPLLVSVNSTGTDINPFRVALRQFNASTDYTVDAIRVTTYWPLLDYCTPNPSSVDGMGITNVSIDTINNSTGAETGNYGNYTSMIANATQGQSLPISITLSTGYTYDMWAWVDWNNDFDFTDAGEEYFLGTSTNSNPTIFTSNIAIPSGATLGNHRLRIGGADSGLGTTSPSNSCYTGSYAAFEDYTLNILAAPAIDASIVSISGDFSCTASGDSLTIEVGSLGTSALTSVPMLISINGGSYNSFGTYSGSISLGNTDFITLPVSANSGINTFSIVTSVSGDANANNDTLSASFLKGNVEVALQIQSGSYGNEVSWALVDSTTGFQIDTVGLSTYSSNTTYNYVYCLDSNATYTFRAYDQYGDSWNGGTYAFTVCSGVLTIANNGGNVPSGSTSFGYSLESTENFTIPGSCPSCLAPTTLTATNMTTTSAQLGWTENGTATAWVIEYDTAGFTPGTGTLMGASSNPYTINGLSANTAYEFYVQANCGNDSSTWAGPFAFTTPCNVYTVPYFEGFESGYTQDAAVGGCLSQASEAGTQVWSANTSLTSYSRTPYAGSWNAYLRYSNTDWIFIPIALNSGTVYTAEVYARQDGSNATYSNITIAYGTTNSAAGMTNNIVGPTGIVSGAYQLIGDTFTVASTGTYYIGIKGYMNGSPWYISLDNISVYATPLNEVQPSAIANVFDCGGNADSVTVDITNNALNTITSLPILVSVNGGSYVSAGSYTGSIAIGNTDSYTFPVTVASGFNTISVVTSLTGDINNANDTISATYLKGNMEVNLNINTASYGSEVYWSLVDSLTGNVIDSVGPNTYANSSNYTYTYCLDSNATYIFNAYDDWGDGWNGGTYSITVPCSPTYILANNGGNEPNNGASGAGLETSELFHVISSCPTFDASITAFSASGANTCDSTDTLMVVISNLGTGSISNFDIIGNQNGGQNDTLAYLDTIMGGGSDTLYFPVTLVPGNNTFNAYTYLIEDIDFSNDSNSTSIFYSVIYSTASGVDVSCPENTTGLAAVTVDSGGVAPFTYAWNDPASTTTNTVQNLGVGTYNVTITDDNGCQFENSVTISSVNASPSVSISGTDTICGGSSTTLDAGAGFSNYAWSNNGQNQTINVTMTGTYSVTITDTNGCTADDAFDVFAYNLITLTTSGVDVTCEGGSDGVVAATATGGTSTFNYEWNDGTMSSANIDVEAGTYYVTVVDGSGCSVEDSITIGFINAAPAFSFNPSSIGSEGSATINAGGAFAEYEWSNGASTSEITVTASGAYVCTVTDTNGCTATDTINVEIWPLGIGQVEATSVSVYPNPSTGIFNLNMTNVPVDQVEVTVMSINGQVISTSTFNSSNGNVNNAVDLSNAASGIYLMQLNINGNITTVRLNVQ